MGCYGGQWVSIVNLWDFRVLRDCGKLKAVVFGTKQDQATIELSASQDIAAERCSFSVLMREVLYARFGRENARRPISRVLSRPLAGPWMTIPLGRPLPGASRDLPGRRWRKRSLPRRPLARPAGRPPLCGLAPGGVCRAAAVTGSAVRSYRTLSPLPATRPLRAAATGGLLSVALSLGSPPPGITRHRVSVEPGLSSSPPSPAGPRSSSRLARAEVERLCPGVNRGRAARNPRACPGDPRLGSLLRYSAATLAQQVIALQTELHRPKPL